MFGFKCNIYLSKVQDPRTFETHEISKQKITGPKEHTVGLFVVLYVPQKGSENLVSKYSIFPSFQNS